ncbi:MAG: mercuric transport protein periplasmic component [Candidatus Marinimicrobia bacterium]|nr:mercuric transport protein periplasmic component [Candidatus Neomarinimicrobiota bacterium]
MGKIIYLFLISFSFLEAKEITQTFNIDGMMCGMSCPIKVKEATNEIKGIKSCNVSYENSNVIITFDDELVDTKTIANKIADYTYYKVELVNDKKSFWEKLFEKN